jgi:hypothetical protein
VGCLVSYSFSSSSSLTHSLTQGGLFIVHCLHLSLCSLFILHSCFGLGKKNEFLKRSHGFVGCNDCWFIPAMNYCLHACNSLTCINFFPQLSILRVPTWRFLTKCIGSLEGGGHPEGLCAREGGPFSWVV